MMGDRQDADGTGPMAILYGDHITTNSILF